MDIEQIDNVLTNTDKAQVQYSDAQWLFLQDNNSNQYTSYLQFITTTLKMQFIDYHNSYVWMPVRLEVPEPLDSISQVVGAIPKPPILALKESVLSLIGNVVISTDQGQTLVNDINTQFINNLRLQVEHSIDWVNSEGSLLDFAYDKWLPIPSNSTSDNTGPDGAAGSGYQQGRGYLAPLGIEPGALNSAPDTNDVNEFGQVQNGGFTFGTTSGVITSFNGIAVPINTGTVTAAGGTNQQIFSVVFPNGSIGYAPYTTTSTSGSTGAQAIASIGGIYLSAFAGLPAGTYSVQGSGTGYDLNSNALGFDMTFNLGVTVTAGTPNTAAFTTIGNALVPGGTVAATQATVQGQPGNRNFCYNQGFADRVTIFQNTSTYQWVPSNNATPGAGTGTTIGGAPNTNGYHYFYYVAVIPNKLVHDFWMQLNIPIINVGFNIQYFFAQTNGANNQSTYPPFMTSNNTQLVNTTSSTTINTLSPPVGLDNTQKPAIYYGQALGGGMGCRLYYRSVKMQPKDNAAMAQKLTSGFTKSIKFISTDFITPQANIIAPGTGQSQILLEQSVVHPLRVWALSYPNQFNITPTAGTTLVNPNGSLIRSNVYAPGVIPGWWINTNILLNNVPYWRQSFMNFQDQWEQIREQFDPDQGSMIRYVDWRNYKRYLCFDLTRISDRLQSPTEPVSLLFQGTRNDNLPYSLEMFFLVERLNQVTFRFSASDVAIVVGNLD